MTASDGISYRVKVTQRTRNGTGTEVTEGAFDPVRATGCLNSPYPGGVYLERLVDGVRYVSSAGSRGVWKQYPGRHDGLAYDRNLNGATNASADPERLFDALRASGAKITRTGPNTDHFEVTTGTAAPGTGASPTSGVSPTSGASAAASEVLVGDVTVDADNRIAKIEYEQTSRVEKNGRASTSTVLVTVELSGHGTPVDVARPTDIVVVR